MKFVRFKTFQNVSNFIFLKHVSFVLNGLTPTNLLRKLRCRLVPFGILWERRELHVPFGESAPAGCGLDRLYS